MTKLSPAADNGDLPAQVRHPFHPGKGHSLKLVPGNDGVEFRCNGCKLPGKGARYECKGGAACDHDFHIRCALAPAQREIGGNMFVLHRRPPDAGRRRHSGRRRRRLCDACGGAATGFVYHCADLDHDVHPCCAHLQETLDLGGGLFLELCMEDDAPQRRCAYCDDDEKKTKWLGLGGPRRVNRGCWSYRSVRGRCGDDDMFLHVACARNLACDDSFTKVKVSLAAPASKTGSGTVVVDAGVVDRSDQEMVTVKASGLKVLLLKGGRGHKGRGRWLRILSIIARAVIGVIFGDPTAMIVAAGQALFSGDG